MILTEEEQREYDTHVRLIGHMVQGTRTYEDEETGRLVVASSFGRFEVKHRLGDDRSAEGLGHLLRHARKDIARVHGRLLRGEPAHPSWEVNP